MRFLQAFSVLMFVLAIVMALGGCANRPPLPPAERVVTVVQKEVVRVPCVNASDVATEPVHVSSQLNGQAAHDLLVVDQSALDLRTWGERLFARLMACTGPPTATPRPGTSGSGASPPRR